MTLDLSSLSPSFDLKELAEADLAAVLDIYLSNPDYFKHCPPEPSFASVEEDMKALPQGKNLSDKYFLGVYKNTQLIGVLDLIFAYPDDQTVFIGLLILDKQYQGHGLGSQLVEELGQGLAPHFSRLRLAFVPENQEARYFWLKQGFLPVGKVKDKGTYCVQLAEKKLADKTRKEFV